MEILLGRALRNDLSQSAQISRFLVLAARAGIWTVTQIELDDVRGILWIIEDFRRGDWQFLSLNGFEVHISKKWVILESIVPLHA